MWFLGFIYGNINLISRNMCRNLTKSRITNTKPQHDLGPMVPSACMQNIRPGRDNICPPVIRWQKGSSAMVLFGKWNLGAEFQPPAEASPGHLRPLLNDGFVNNRSCADFEMWWAWFL